MILRVMRGRGGRDQVVALHDALRVMLGAGATGRGGPQRVHLGWRPVRPAGGGEGSGDPHDVLVIAHWASAEAAARADARQTSPLAIAERSLGPLNVVHFEVDDSIRRDSDEEPLAIRLATGRFSKPGADAEMQQLLRERAPHIGAEMAEAWVGRRISGRAVEVTFISTWRRIPEGRPLEEAFWSDIALRYDDFVVEVYTAVGVE